MTKGKAIAILTALFMLLGVVTYIDFYGINEEGAVSASDISLGLDLAGGVSITYQVFGKDGGAPTETELSDALSVLEQRAYKESTEALVYQEGEDRIVVEIPGVSNADEIFERLKSPGTMYFIHETSSNGDVNYSYTYQTDEAGKISVEYTLNRSIEELEADGSIALYGTDVKLAEARSFSDQLGNSKIGVSLEMTEEGAQKFANATRRAAVKGETLGIYYDGKFISVPGVDEAITDGKAQISGSFDYDSATTLAEYIRIGGLDVELTELQSKVVGAQLGSDAVTTSLKAAAIGLIVVIVLMLVLYRLPGFVASIALLIYTALVVFLLNGFGMTLTLPGIAGIILSIGMAVDANVIIFARIKEEIASGKTVQSAIKIGFEKATSAIVDGNITTLIAAVVLLILGSGSVKGFGQTLALGIALSMFTALFVTKWLLNAFYALGFKDEKWYGSAKEKKTVDFLGKRKLCFIISCVLILSVGLGMGINKMGTGKALNYSLEFVGGTSVSVAFDKELTLDEIETNVIPKLEDITGSAVQPQPVTGTTEVVFKSNDLTDEKRAAITDMLSAEFGVNADNIQMETISSTISGEMRKQTIIAVVVAIVLMLFYIRIRFKDIRFGFSGVAALVHDVLVVLAFYAFARISVGSTFIACMLTIVGYSINATIVIFDRIRENKEEMKKNTDLSVVVNTSITQSLTRSIFTSLTTVIMVAALYVLGVTAIKEFALPLIVGLVCGTYSSICIAGALYYVLIQKFPQREEEEE